MLNGSAADDSHPDLAGESRPARAPKARGGSGPCPTRAECLERLSRALTQLAAEAAAEAAHLVPRDTIRFEAAELRVRGDAEAAARALEQALTWYRSCPEPERRRHRAAFARTLYEAEEWEEARALFAELAAEQPENVFHLGHLGTLAARRGDRAEAERISQVLAHTAPRHLFGAHILWRARIAAQLGERQRALQLLDEALIHGQPHGVWLFTDPDLDPIRDDPAFRALLAHLG